MRFSFTPEQIAFREEMRSFLAAEVPPEFGFGAEEGRDSDEFFAVARRFMGRLAEKGLLVTGWPTEYGGGGRSFIEQGILSEELGYFGVPFADSTGRLIAGPAIMLFGTPEQKAKHLPQIASGRIVWCQGYSEPNAGSDLAALRTHARREGDEYVVNGAKVFTSRAEWADYIFAIVRTDPSAPKKQLGLSLLLIDMQSPGITVRRLPNFAHGYPQAEVIFDEVRVPAENLIGEEGKGWTLATASLAFERVDMMRLGHLRHVIEHFIEFTETFERGGTRPIDDPVIRERLADVVADYESFRLMCWEVISLQAQGKRLSYEPATCNFYGKDVIQHLAQLMMDVLGPWGLLEEGAAESPLDAYFLREYLYSANKHGQGTSEVQRDIVAKHGLRLPRD